MDAVAHPQFLLTKHVFPCDVDGHLIVLDLRKDKYMRLGDTEANALRYLLNGQESPLAPAPSGLDQAIKELVEQGILATSLADGKDAAPSLPAQATLDMKGWPHVGLPPIRPGHVLSCFRAFARAKYMRRFWSIERTVGHVRKRRERNLANAGATAHPDLEDGLERIRDLVEIFRIVKVLFYTAKNHCLFDSLTLVEFLASYSIYPLWVFGVRMGPFGAHCWVQDGAFIYNDTPSHTGSFQPIMNA